MNYDAPDRGEFDVAMTVYIRRPKDDDEGWLSAFSTYPKRPGESWHRGNDLPDGPADPDTVKRILASMVSILEGARK